MSAGRFPRPAPLLTALLLSHTSGCSRFRPPPFSERCADHADQCFHCSPDKIGIRIPPRKIFTIMRVSFLRTGHVVMAPVNKMENGFRPPSFGRFRSGGLDVLCVHSSGPLQIKCHLSVSSFAAKGNGVPAQADGKGRRQKFFEGREKVLAEFIYPLEDGQAVLR